MTTMRLLCFARFSPVFVATLIFLCGGGTAWARQNAAPVRTVTLRVGEGINFATGQVTRRKAQADMALAFVPPQPGIEWAYQEPGQNVTGYNPSGSGRVISRPSVRTTMNLPVLSAARIESFQTPPNLAKLSVGDVNGWSDDEYQVSPGRYILARGLVDGKHYLVHITKLTGAAKDTKAWRLTFTYKPVRLALAAAGTGGAARLPLRGIVMFQERFNSQQIVDLDLATGRVTPRWDGTSPSAASTSGETAYVDKSGRIVIVGPDNKERAVLRVDEGSSGVRGVALSPDGAKIAYNGRGIRVKVVTREGKPVADFPNRSDPAWLPDGRLVVAGHGGYLGDSPGLFVSDAGLTKLTRIDPDLDPSYPAVRPDGKQIAFVQKGRIWVINPDGTGLKQVTTEPRAQTLPTYSPDGKYIVFCWNDYLVDQSVAVVRVADGKVNLLVDESGRKHDPSVGRIVWR